MRESPLVDGVESSSVAGTTTSVAVKDLLGRKGYSDLVLGSDVGTISQGRESGLSPTRTAILGDVLVNHPGEEVSLVDISPEEVIRDIFILDIVLRRGSQDIFHGAMLLSIRLDIVLLSEGLGGFEQSVVEERLLLKNSVPHGVGLGLGVFLKTPSNKSSYNKVILLLGLGGPSVFGDTVSAVLFDSEGVVTSVDQSVPLMTEVLTPRVPDDPVGLVNSIFLGGSVSYYRDDMVVIFSGI